MNEITFSPEIYESLTGIPFPTSEKITIPNAIIDKEGNELFITKIADGAFLSDKYNDITEVCISEGIVEIGVKAFGYKKNLTKVVLPTNSIKSIGDLAFSKCENLSYIYLSDSITNIGASAFDGCTYLEYINIPHNIHSIGIRTFAATGLKELIIPDSVYIIQECAFSSCIELTNIHFSNALVHICSGAFMNCSSLKELNMPKNIHSIDKSAFADCSNLQSVFFERHGIKYIGEYAFAECRNLTSVTLNNKCIICDMAFMNCESLKTFNLQDETYTKSKQIRNKFGTMIRKMVFNNTLLSKNN